MKTEVHRRPFGTMESPRFVVMLSCMNGAILLGRHEGRDTWETQGGHIEPGETPEQAARRELYEECGAVKYTLTPLFDYWVGLESSSGCAFAAQIEQLGALPPFEIEEVCLFDALPENLTAAAFHLDERNAALICKAVRLSDAPKTRWCEARGAVRLPAHRRASEASLKPECLAKPISRAEHRRVEGTAVRSKKSKPKNSGLLFFR